jgi:integrase
MPRNPLPYCLRKHPISGYYYFKLPGWKSYKTTGTRIKSEALTVVQNYLRDQGERTKDITLREYAEPFYDYERCPHIQRIGKNITRKSALVIRQYLKNHVFTDPIAEKPLGKITIRDVAEFRARLEKKQVLTGKGNYLSPSTINKIMAALKVIFTEAVLNRDIPFNPCQGLVRLKPSQNPRGVFSTEELKRFFDKKNWRNIEAWTCFALDALTGMRAGELLAFRWGNYKDDTLYIIEAWKDDKNKGEPKWGKQRFLPVSSCMRRLLEEYKKYRRRVSPNDLLFCDEGTGKRRGPTWLKKHFYAAMKIARIPDTDSDGNKRTPHSFRHTLNTILLSKGCNPLLVRMYLGWSEGGLSKLSPVQHGYTHFSAMSMEKLVQTIDGVFTDILFS